MSITLSPTSWRRYPLTVVGAAAVLISGVAINATLASGAGTCAPGACLSGSTFESGDGNDAVAADVLGTDLDWSTYTVNGTLNGVTYFKQQDKAPGNNDDSYGNGAKEDDVNPGVVSGSIPPNKSDLDSFSTAYETNPTNNHTLLYLKWTRLNVLGSADMDFEFNQLTTPVSSATPTVHTYPSGQPVRTDGDILITYDYGGSGAPVIALLHWLSGSESASLCYSSSALPCWGNRSQVSTLNPPTANGASYPSGLSGEAGIDLTAANVFATSGSCETLGGAVLKSRSSGSSFTSSLKDFILLPVGQIHVSNCGSVTVTKTANDNSSQAGAVFTLYSGGSLPAPVGSPTTNRIVDPADGVVGSCTVQTDTTCTTSSGNTSFINLQPGQYTLDETTVPSGYTKPTTLADTFTVTAGVNTTKAYVDTFNPASLTVSKQDDGGGPVNGATLQLYSGGSAIGTPINTCTTNAVGACLWPGPNNTTLTTLTGLTPGQYTMAEATPPSGYTAMSPDTFTLVNAQTKTVTYTDPRKFKVIVLVCTEHDNKLHPSSVTIDGTTGLTTASSSIASSTLTESGLCGITAGSKSGLASSSTTAKTMSVTIAP